MLNRFKNFTPRWLFFHTLCWSQTSLLLSVTTTGTTGFPSKESPCNAGDPGSTPGSGRSPAEGIGYPLQYSWASLVAQLVKNLPAMRETWVEKIPWRRERLPTPVFWPTEFHGLYSPWVVKSQTWLSNFHFTFTFTLCHIRQILMHPLPWSDNLFLNISTNR